jgi:class 3 adenylate cyclase
MSEAPEGLRVDERRLAAILAADVAGYSRLMGRNEEETVRDLGDIIHDGTRTYGDGINVAARLEPLAEPGGICISSTVRDAIFGKLGLPLRDIRSRRRGHARAATGWAQVYANIAGSRPLSGL